VTVSNPHESHFVRAISTGGGIMEVLEIDGFPLSMAGDYYETLLLTSGDGDALRSHIETHFEADFVLLHTQREQSLVQVKAQSFVPEELLQTLHTAFGIAWVKRVGPVLPVLSRRETAVPFTSCASLLDWDAGANTPLWQYAVQYECARGGLSEAEAEEKMVEIVRILRKSIASGIEGTTYEDRVLGHQSGEFQRKMQEGTLLKAGPLNRIILYVTALMEVKSSMGVIVAMPTAGACAALPGAIIGMAEEMGLGEAEMARSILASGLIGTFITTAWTFAAEVGGCQAEGGAASAMAAAGLVTLAGGSLNQALAAASMALQSMIGLICDPIANRVEAPCLGKNVMAAANALSCANMALAGFDQVIPFDEVVETAKRVGNQMPRELRCTALGGLSITPTSLRIEKQLSLNRGCGGGCSCG
jgi:L-serine dehydratase